MKILQFHPTTKCNRKCSFCSYRDENAIDMPIEIAQAHICKAHESGYNILKISGGGEPLLYPYIITLFCEALFYHFAIHLQTNGDYLSFIHRKYLTDIRISYGDGIPFCLKENTYMADGFSYVLTSTPDWENLNHLLKYSLPKGKYVRIIQDEGNLQNVPTVHTIKKHIAAEYLHSELLSMWDTKQFHQGRNPCSSTSPVVTPYGIFPCCRTQWAEYPKIFHGYNKEMLIIGQELTKDWHFNGSNCTRCYY